MNGNDDDAAPKARILVVDDNPLNLKLLRLVLGGPQYDTRFVVSAEQVEPLLASWRPDLILMDMQLPGASGLDLTRRLKQDPTTKHIQIIILTACAMQAEEETALSVGCDGYLTKPLDTRTLPGLIARCLDSAEEL
jgi:two-component system, cell cycle response regulator DivK